MPSKPGTTPDRPPGSIQSWMGAVSHIARAVNEARSLDSILADVAAHACRLIGFDYCAVMLADDDRQRMQLAGYHGLSADYIAMLSDDDALAIHPTTPDLDSPAGQAFRDRVTVTVSDTRSAGSYGRLSDLAATQGYRGLLATPLRNSEDCFGILVGYLKRPHVFDDRAVELAELLADQMAIAIVTSQLRQSEQQTIAELREHRAIRDWADQQHHRLMNLVLDDIGLQGLVAALADILDARVLVEDAQGRPLTLTGDRDFRPPNLAPVMGSVETRSMTTPSYEAVRVPTEEPCWVAPVIVGGELAGRLWISAGDHDMSAGRRALIERFAVVVGLEILKQRHVLEVEERLSGDLLGDLLHPGGVAQPRSVVDRAAALGHDLTAPHWLAVLTVHDDGPTTSATARMVSKLARSTNALTGRHEDNVVLLLPDINDPLARLNEIHGAVRRTVAPIAVSALLSSRIDDLGGYAPCYELTAGAARLRRLAATGGVVDLRSLGITSLLLLSGTVSPALREFAVTLLAPLRNHDDRRKTELVATLRAWLDHGHSPAAAAQDLVVHVNTVSYRLSRIEELLGRRLGDPKTRLELQLALDVTDVLTASSS